MGYGIEWVTVDLHMQCHDHQFRKIPEPGKGGGKKVRTRENGEGPALATLVVTKTTKKGPREARRRASK